MKQIDFNGYILENTSSKSTKANYVNEAFDVIIDILRINRTRPGLLIKHYETGNGKINGLYLWESKNVIIAVIAGKPYKVTESSGEFTFTDVSGTDTLNSSRRVYFASNDTYVVMANGGQMVVYDNSTTATYIADLDAPTTIDMVAYLDNYILALSADESKFYFSDATAGINSPITWSGDYYSFESTPDITTGICVSNSIIYGIGSESIEQWFNDASPFSRISGGVINIGSKYRDTIKVLDGTIYFLGTDNHVYALNGSQFTSLSLTIDNELNPLDFDNCYADTVDVDGLKFYILTIPDSDMTYVYSVKDNSWLKWSKYLNGTRSEFIGREFIRAFDLNLCTSSEFKALFEFSTSHPIDDNTNIETASQFYKASELLTYTEIWDGVTLKIFSEIGHLQNGTAKFRARQTETNWGIIYDSMGIDDFEATRSSTEEENNMNRLYEVKCVAGAASNAQGLVRFGFMTGYSDVAVIEPSYTYEYTVSFNSPYLGPVGATCTIQLNNGITSSSGGFIESAITNIDYGTSIASYITITVQEEYTKGLFKITRTGGFNVVYSKRTSWINHNSNFKKVSRFLRLKLNRDFIEHISPNVYFELRYRNNGSNWSNWIQVQVKEDSDGFFSYIRNLGTYNERQYELRCLSPVQFTLMEVQEDFKKTKRI